MISQRDLSALARIPQPTIAVLEGGKRRAQPRTVRRLAEALGVEPAELVRKD
jgi:HTH-type transcriptional regulator, competence development regulator